MPENKDSNPSRLNPDRGQVLNRLWEIANLSPEMTRNSVTGQVKSLSIIVAMENLIPDRRAISSEKKSTPAPAQIYASAWLRKQQATSSAITNEPHPGPAANRQEDPPAVPEPKHAPNSVAEDAPPEPNPQSTFANRLTPSEAPEPYVPLFPPVTGTRVGFSIRKNPFAPRPR